MKRHHMAMTVSDGDRGGAVRTAARQTHVVKTQKTRRAGLGPPDGQLAPPGMPGREHTLVLTGELDASTAHALEAEIERLCEEGVTQVTLDLRQLAQIDPVGVAVIVFRCRLCQRRGFGFALIPGGRAIQRAFDQAGVVALLPFRADELALDCASDEPIAPAPVQADAPARGRTPKFEPEPALALALGNGVESSYAQ